VEVISEGERRLTTIMTAVIICIVDALGKRITTALSSFATTTTPRWRTTYVLDVDELRIQLAARHTKSYLTLHTQSNPMSRPLITVDTHPRRRESFPTSLSTMLTTLAGSESKPPVISRLQGLFPRTGAPTTKPSTPTVPLSSSASHVPSHERQSQADMLRSLKIRIVTWNMHESVPKVSDVEET